MNTPILSPRLLDKLPSLIRRPDYDPAHTAIGIVHLGIGAFHRAHQAVYIDDMLRQNPQWAILGASLRSSATAEALNPQGGLYTLNVAGPQGVARRVIGAVKHVLICPAQVEELLAAMCDPAVRIVSLTVTEKGYCHDPATGELDERHPDIIADMANPTSPCSAPGLLVEALYRRRKAGVAPFTVLCCDNLPSNGKTVSRIISRLGALRDPDLGRFMADEVAFPCTMVDRIVPATTDLERTATAEALGCRDAWPVSAEPFSQWVIEDNFPTGRPPFESVGAQMVTDVAPFERMKLRMLNGSHSTLAYLGYLAGHETIADCIADQSFAALIRAMMSDEIMPTLDVPAGTDLGAYRDALLMRFANPGLRHRTWQIAMDGSQKLPQRLLGTIRDRLKTGAGITRLALGVAGWMRYVTGRNEAGAPIDVRDPIAVSFQEIAVAYQGRIDDYAMAMFRLEAVFGNDLPADPRFTEPVLAALRSLDKHGAAATVAAAAITSP
jgi:fructuronate reductase